MKVETGFELDKFLYLRHAYRVFSLLIEPSFHDKQRADAHLNPKQSYDADKSLLLWTLPQGDIRNATYLSTVRFIFQMQITAMPYYM